PSCLYLRPPPPPPLHTLSLHDALPISDLAPADFEGELTAPTRPRLDLGPRGDLLGDLFARCLTLAHSRLLSRFQIRLKLQLQLRDRKSTRLNSSHLVISYAVFCLKKKK